LLTQSCNPSNASLASLIARQFFCHLQKVFVIFCLLVSALGTTHVQPVAAATLTVTSTTNSGTGSLRSIIASASAGDTINFSVAAGSTITLDSEIVINKKLTITGPGSGSLTISGGGTNRIFNITGGTVRISGMTLSNGTSQGEDAVNGTPGNVSALGGAVYVGSGSYFTAENVIFINNAALGGDGSNTSDSSGYNHGAGGGNGGVAGEAGAYGGGGGGNGGAGGYGGGGGGGAGVAGGAGGGYGGDGGDGASTETGFSGGGGGGGLGGAIFVAEGANIGLRTTTFTNNSTVGGNGGSATTLFAGGGGGGGASQGSAIFSAGGLCIESGVSFSGNSNTAGAAGASKCGFDAGHCPGAAEAGGAVDTSTGIFDLSGDHNCSAWYESPTDISLNTNTIYENQPAGNLVGALSSTDPDSGDTFTYTLVSGTGSANNSSFSISGNTLVSSTPFNYEGQSSYSIRIRSTDNHTRYYEEAFTINILNVDEAPTNITLSSSSINENMPASANVGMLTSTDPDSSSFTYTLEDSISGCDGSDNGSFIIFGTSLLTTKPFNYEHTNTYSICIQSADTGTNHYAKHFNITVNNTNDLPTDISLDPVTVDENQSSGAFIGTFGSTDEDTSDTFSYFFVSGTGDTDNSFFAISGDGLYTNSILDFEAQSSYSILVQTMDTPGGTYTKSFTITANDVNDPPNDISLSSDTVDENQPANTNIGILSSTDQDSSSFTYALADGISGCDGSDNASFNLNTDTLRTSVEFDYETASTYVICIESSDDGTPVESYYESIAIQINNINDGPTAITLDNDTINENEGSGSLVGAFSTTDEDSGDTFGYQLVSGTGSADNASFSISGTNLNTAVVLNFETQSTYSIRVRSTDSGSQSVDEVMIITVLDVNDAPTNISISNNQIEENQAIGTTVGNFSTTDQDSSNFTYLLDGAASGCDGTDNASFTISGNTLQSAEIFDLAAKSSYTICVTSTDDGSPALSYSESMVITIIPENIAPVVDHTIPNQNGTAGVAFSYPFPANTFSDADSDPLTYTAGLNSGDSLPTWLTFTNSTRTFSGTAPEAGSWVIRVTANDGNGGTVDTTFTLTMSAQASNTAPVLVNDIPNAYGEVGTGFSYTFPADSFADYDGDTLTYQASLSSGGNLPAWLSFSSSARTFSGTPTAGDAGIITIRVRALDSRGGEAYGTFNLGVDQNVAPSLLNPIPDQAAIQGSLWTYVVPANTFDDADGDALTYAADMSDGSVLPSWLSFDAGTCTFSGTPPVSTSALVYELRVTAMDSLSQSVADVFVLSPWSIADTGSHLPAGSQMGIYNTGSTGPVTPPSGATRWFMTVDMQIWYGSEQISTVSNGVEVCFNVTETQYEAISHNTGRLAIGYSHNNGDWTLLPTYQGGSATQVCAMANQFSLFDIFLRPVQVDSAVLLPETGFAPNIISSLPEQTPQDAYQSLGDVWVEVPALSLKSSVVGVPFKDNTWEVSWLQDDLGWLDGSSFPGMDGNSILAGHVYDSNGQAGPFASLSSLRWGDQIIVHVFGEQYIYEVRTVKRWVSANDMSILKHQNTPWLSLITCQGYDEKKDTYRWRTIVQAVLMETRIE
jgi:LPXTG-site transpeptidase (sortase) family protein